MESRGEGETEEIGSSVLPTPNSVLQVRQRAEQQIRRTDDVFKERTRQLAQAFAIMRALESTSNAILVTDEKNNVIDFNDKYLDMWTTSHSVNEYSIQGLRLPAPFRWLMQSRPEQAAAEKVSPICDSPLVAESYILPFTMTRGLSNEDETGFYHRVAFNLFAHHVCILASFPADTVRNWTTGIA